MRHRPKASDQGMGWVVLVESQPPDGGFVDDSPAAVRLSFSEAIAPRLSSARLIDSFGRTVAGTRNAVGSEGSPSLTVELPPLPDGAYVVVWQVTTADYRRTTSGVIVFGVGA